jgi:hypothetical protein
MTNELIVKFLLGEKVEIKCDKQHLPQAFGSIYGHCGDTIFTCVYRARLCSSDPAIVALTNEKPQYQHGTHFPVLIVQSVDLIPEEKGLDRKL